MADEKINNSDKVIVAEFKIYMHCYGCERTVAKAISKIKGVEKFITDMIQQKVIITGKIDPVKVVKKLKKKTGKRAEILVIGNKEEPKDPVKELENSAVEEISKEALDLLINNYLGDSAAVHTLMFSDENANSCSVM